MTVWLICCESTKLLSCWQTGSGCRCRTNSQKRLTQSRRTGRIYAGSETGKALSKLRRRGAELWLTADISYLVGLITASWFKDAESRFLPTLTIISAGMLLRPFDSSVSCGVRRDCPRYPNYDGFKGKRRGRFLTSRFDVSEANACNPEIRVTTASHTCRAKRYSTSNDGDSLPPEGESGTADRL